MVFGGAGTRKITTTADNVNFLRAVSLTGPLLINTAGTLPGFGDITFSSTINGPGSLTLNTGSTTTLVGNVGQTIPLTSLTTDGSGGVNDKTILPARVTTSGSQSFSDPVTLVADTTLLSTAGGDIKLFSNVFASNHALTLDTAGNALFGATLFNLSGLVPLTAKVIGTTTIGTALKTTDITLPGFLKFTGPVAVMGNVTITTTNTATRPGVTNQISSTGAQLLFDRTVDGPGSLTAKAGGVVVFQGNVGSSTALDALTVTAPFVSLNNTRTKNLLKVDAMPAAVTDGSDGLVNLIGSSYRSDLGSVEFNPTARTLISKHATILSTVGNADISAPFGNFTMGNEQKMLINSGALTIFVGGTATLGDTAASVSINLTANAVRFQGRALNGFFNSNRKDHGLGFVSPTIRFNSGNLAFVPGTNPVVVFSTKGSIAAVRQIPGLSLEIDKDIEKQFGKPDLKLDKVTFLPVEPNVIFGTVQPIASGTRVTEPGQLQVVFVLEIPKLVELPQDTFLSKGDQDILRNMGINPREANPEENITISFRRGVFRQPIEGKAEMDDPEYLVVVNRLTTEEVKEIIKAYQQVAGNDLSNISKIAALFGELVTKFHTEVPGNPGLDGFAKWLQSKRGTEKPAEELAKDLDDLSAIFVKLSQIGLTKKEVFICKMKICLALNAGGTAKVDEIVALVEGAAKLPPQAPRPGATMPPPAPDVPPAAEVPGAPPATPLPPPPEPAAPPSATPGTPPPPPPPTDAPAAPKAQ